jgi:hypothetical protein
MSALWESAREVPHGVFLFVAGLGAILTQLGVILAQRRRPSATAPDLRLNVGAGLAILMMLGVGFVCVHVARELMTSAFRGGDPSQRATDLSRGLSGQLNAIPLMTSSAMIAGILWLVGLNRELERRPSQGARRAFAGLVGFGGVLVAAATGVVRWSAGRIHELASLAGLDPTEKVSAMVRALDESQDHLRSEAHLTTVGLGVAAIVATILAARRDRSAPAHVAPSRPSTVAPLAVTVGALALAAALFGLARPLRAESAQPWPPGSSGDGVLLVVDIVTPEVRGPDPVERAPVVQVFNDKILLDGAPCDLESLGDKLRTLRSYFLMLHPTERFNGAAVLLVDYSLPIDRFVALAHTIHDAGYDRPLLTFTKVETLQRPVFGKLRRVVATGARLKLLDRADIEAAGDDLAREGTLLTPDDLDIYDDLAKKVVALRNAGGAVALNLGKPRAP